MFSTKRAFCWVLALVLLAQLIPGTLPNAAAVVDPITISLSDVCGSAGDTLTVTASVSRNAGFAGFTFLADYDASALTLTGITQGAVLDSADPSGLSTNVSRNIMNWATSDNITGNGTLLTLTFTVNADAAPGTYPVTLTVSDFFYVDSAGRYFSCNSEIQAGSITVEGSAASTVPTLKGSGFTLSFEDEILANFYYTAQDTADVAQQGMLVFYSDPGTADFAKADAVYESEYVAASGSYIATTAGIAAKEMGDNRFYCAYAKLADGTYAYSPLYQYSPKKYATNMLARASTSPEQKALCVAMLNYGAAAQNFFNYRTDDLMNAGLTDEQKAMVLPYDASYFKGAIAADAGKIGSFAATSTGFSGKSASVSFEGAFAINYYFAPSYGVKDGVKLYIWSPADYEAAATLTASNATAVVTMNAQSGGAYWGQVEGIAAKMVDKTYYVAGVYTDMSGNTYCTGVIAYSLSKYCLNNAKPGKDMQELASATAMYGYYANAFFDK